ncbi:MAG: hypothetical protein JWO72_1167 [Caulobacteraceae bacterium]|nr:hypothetical protein [Caulobacteraceae bacterium]
MLLESMSLADDVPEEGLLEQARLKLRSPVLRERTWPAVAAAAFFAVAALGFAVASILAPPVILTPAAKIGVR